MLEKDKNLLPLLVFKHPVFLSVA